MQHSEVHGDQGIKNIRRNRAKVSEINEIGQQQANTTDRDGKSDRIAPLLTATHGNLKAT